MMLMGPTCAEVVQERHTGEYVNQRSPYPLRGTLTHRVPSLQGHCGSTTLKTTPASDLHETVGFIDGAPSPERHRVLLQPVWLQIL